MGHCEYGLTKMQVDMENKVIKLHYVFELQRVIN